MESSPPSSALLAAPPLRNRTATRNGARRGLSPCCGCAGRPGKAPGSREVHCPVKASPSPLTGMFQRALHFPHVPPAREGRRQRAPAFARPRLWAAAQSCRPRASVLGSPGRVAALMRADASPADKAAPPPRRPSSLARTHTHTRTQPAFLSPSRAAPHTTFHIHRGLETDAPDDASPSFHLTASLTERCPPRPPG